MRREWGLLLLFACTPERTQPEAPEEAAVSRKLRVIQKTGTVWGRDLAAGLGLAETELCRELGVSDCITGAHRITLGGVEPERLGIDRPLEHPPVSAPIAADRVAIAACARRYALDREGPSVLFGPVLGADTVESRTTVAENLIRRLLTRHPTADDVQVLLALHTRLAPVATDLTRDWSVGACVVVATSTEALFY